MMAAIPSRRSSRGALRIEGKFWINRRRAEASQPGEPRKSVRMQVGLVSELRSRRAAELERDRLLALRGMAPRLEGVRILFRDFAPSYFRGHVTGIVRASSERCFRGALQRYLLPQLGDSWLDAIDVARVQQLIATLGREELAVATIRRPIKLLRQMLSVAQREGFAAAPIGPWTLKFPKDSRPRRSRRCYSPEESRQIIDAASGWLKALCAILAFTGCRAGEALGLTWAHVDFENGRLLIRQAAVEGQLYSPKTDASIADIPMPERLAQILRAFRAQWQSQGSDLLFQGRSGDPLGADGIRKRHFAPLLKRLGIPHGALHGFRHAWATELSNDRVDPNTIRTLLRHADLRTTLSYSHTSIELQHRAADAVVKRISNPEGSAPHA